MVIALAALSCQKIYPETIIYQEIPVEVPVETEDGDKAFAYSVQAFDVLPTNSAAENKVRLQNAIDWASARGAALWVEPVEGGYPVQSGIVLKKNVSLLGVHGPTGRGTVKDGKPTGSLFVITDKTHPFITVQSASQIKGCQFYYPEQGFNDASKIVAVTRNTYYKLPRKTGNQQYVYVVTALNRLHNESGIRKQKVKL